MSRSGCSEVEIDSPEAAWSYVCWRGAVKSAIRGARGQAFLREMLAAFDALPEPRLIQGDLFVLGDFTGEIVDVCAIGAVGLARGTDMRRLNVHEPAEIAAEFGIAMALVSEIEWENDEGCYRWETPEERFNRVREWVAARIIPTPTPESK